MRGNKRAVCFVLAVLLALGCLGMAGCVLIVDRGNVAQSKEPEAVQSHVPEDKPDIDEGKIAVGDGYFEATAEEFREAINAQIKEEENRLPTLTQGIKYSQYGYVGSLGESDVLIEFEYRISDNKVRYISIDCPLDKYIDEKKKEKIEYYSYKVLECIQGYDMETGEEYFLESKQGNGKSRIFKGPGFEIGPSGHGISITASN